MSYATFSTNYAAERERQELDRLMQEFLAKGGKIERLAPGERSQPLLNKAPVRGASKDSVAKAKKKSKAEQSPEDDFDDLDAQVCEPLPAEQSYSPRSTKLTDTAYE